MSCFSQSLPRKENPSEIIAEPMRRRFFRVLNHFWLHRFACEQIAVRFD